MSVVRGVVGCPVGEFPLVPPRLIYATDESGFLGESGDEIDPRQEARLIGFVVRHAAPSVWIQAQVPYTQDAHPQTRVAVDVKF